MLIPKNITTFFRIEEGTRNEALSIGGVGRVVRWAKNDTDLGQQWCIYPVRDDLVMIQTLQNGEFLTVGDDGVYRRWARHADENRQLFRFVNPADDGTFNIEEQTRKQYLSIGSDGTAVRWDPNGEISQRFKLEPIVQFKTKPKLTTPRAKPDMIPAPPEFTSISDPHVVTTERVLVAQERMFSIEVDDPAFASKLAQVQANPYYLLSRYQQWDSSPDVGGTHVFSGREEETYTYQVLVGFTERHVQEISETIGWAITAGVSSKLTGSKKDEENGTSVRGEVTGSLTVQYQNSTTKSDTDEKTKTRQTVKTHTVRYPAQGEPCKVVEWTLVDTFELARGDGTLVGTWRVVNKSTNYHRSATNPKTAARAAKQPAFAQP